MCRFQKFRHEHEICDCEKLHRLQAGCTKQCTPKAKALNGPARRVKRPCKACVKRWEEHRKQLDEKWQAVKHLVNPEREYQWTQDEKDDWTVAAFDLFPSVKAGRVQKIWPWEPDFEHVLFEDLMEERKRLEEELARSRSTTPQEDDGQWSELELPEALTSRSSS